MNQLFNRDFSKFRKACHHHIALSHLTKAITEITYSILTIHSQILMFGWTNNSVHWEKKDI